MHTCQVGNLMGGIISRGYAGRQRAVVEQGQTRRNARACVHDRSGLT